MSSRDVLFGAYKVLMEQVDKDATPQFLDNLKHTLIHGEDTSMNTKFAELSKCLNHPSLNPLALPFSYMINGVLPDDTNNEQTDIEMGNETTEASSKPENNTQFSFSKSTTIRDENKSGSEEISSDEPEDEETEPTKSKKTKVSRRSKNTKTKNRIVL